jgi:hypothetical protein
MNDTTNSNPPAAIRVSDGFDSVDDGGSNSIIRGTKLKFGNDAKWSDGDDNVIAPQRELLIVEQVRSVQKWIDEKPTETRILAPDEYFPDIEKLNAEAPPEEWRDAFGRRIGPWQRCKVLYLFDPATLEGFSWPTSTAGGFRAISELQERVHRARMVQGDDNLYPLVTLSDTFMNTQFGGRQRPQFKVQRFVVLGGAKRPLLEPAKPAESLNDAIPF